MDKAYDANGNGTSDYCADEPIEVSVKIDPQSRSLPSTTKFDSVVIKDHMGHVHPPRKEDEADKRL
jgi:hypothetical protein